MILNDCSNLRFLRIAENLTVARLVSSLSESLPYPEFDSVEHCFVGVFLGDACPLQNLEGVVPTFHDVKIGGSFQLFDDRPQLVR